MTSGSGSDFQGQPHPYTYLVDVLQRVGQHPAARVAELTLRRWKTLFADHPLRSDLHGACALAVPPNGQSVRAAPDNGEMAAITTELLVNAARRVERPSLSERTQLADELHAVQPNLFFSVLALQGFEAAIEDMEMVLMLLIVFHEAMKASGKQWPVISEDVQDRALKRITARMRPAKGLTGQQQMRTTAQSIANHPEQPMLAYVFAKFGEHGLLGIETETQKMVMLVALNMVECIALTAPATTKRVR